METFSKTVTERLKMRWNDDFEMDLRLIGFEDGSVQWRIVKIKVEKCIEIKCLSEDPRETRSRLRIGSNGGLL
jgi:hypothetical protein